MRIFLLVFFLGALPLIANQSKDAIPNPFFRWLNVFSVTNVTCVDNSLDTKLCPMYSGFKTVLLRLNYDGINPNTGEPNGEPSNSAKLEFYPRPSTNLIYRILQHNEENKEHIKTLQNVPGCFNGEALSYTDEYYEKELYELIEVRLCPVDSSSKKFILRFAAKSSFPNDLHDFVSHYELRVVEEVEMNKSWVDLKGVEWLALPGLYSFSQAEEACKTKGYTLSGINELEETFSSLSSGIDDPDTNTAFAAFILVKWNNIWSSSKVPTYINSRWALPIYKPYLEIMNESEKLNTLCRRLGV